MANNPTEAIPTPPSGTASETPAKRKANGRAPSVDGDAADGEINVSLPPAAKKQKRESSSEDADARLAAELQAQENRLSRGRVTRNANSKPPKAKPKKKAKKKSEKKVKSDDDDSNAEGDSEANGKKRKAGGGFQKPFNLSYPLQEVTGETQVRRQSTSRWLTADLLKLSRPQVVKKLWAYIKENELQDPNDKRQIRCDDKLQAVFKQTRVDMFQMNKLLGNQLYPIEDE